MSFIELGNETLQQSEESRNVVLNLLKIKDFPDFVISLFFSNGEVQLNQFFQMCYSSPFLLTILRPEFIDTVRKDATEILYKSIRDFYLGSFTGEEISGAWTEKETLAVKEFGDFWSCLIRSVVDDDCESQNDLIIAKRKLFIQHLKKTTSDNFLLDEYQHSLIVKMGPSKTISELRRLRSYFGDKVYSTFIKPPRQSSDLDKMFMQHRAVLMNKAEKRDLSSINSIKRTLISIVENMEAWELEHQNNDDDEELEDEQSPAETDDDQKDQLDNVDSIMMSKAGDVGVILRLCNLISMRLKSVDIKLIFEQFMILFSQNVISMTVKTVSEIISAEFLSFGMRLPNQLKLSYCKLMNRISKSTSDENLFDALIPFKGDVGEYIILKSLGIEFKDECNKMPLSEILLELTRNEHVPITSFSCDKFMDVTPDGYYYGMDFATKTFTLIIYEVGWVHDKQWKVKIDEQKWEKTIDELNNSRITYCDLFGNEYNGFLSVNLMVTAMNNRDVKQLKEYREDKSMKTLIDSITGSIGRLRSCLGLSGDKALTSILVNPIYGNLNEPRQVIFSPNNDIIEELQKKIESEVMNDYSDPKEKEHIKEEIGYLFPDPSDVLVNFEELKYFLRDNLQRISESRWVRMSNKRRIEIREFIENSIIVRENVRELFKSQGNKVTNNLFKLNEIPHTNQLKIRYKYLSHMLEHFDSRFDKKTKHLFSASYQKALEKKFWVSTNGMYGVCGELKNYKKWLEAGFKIITKSQCCHCLKAIELVRGKEKTSDNTDNADVNVENDEFKDDDDDFNVGSVLEMFENSTSITRVDDSEANHDEIFETDVIDPSEMVTSLESLNPKDSLDEFIESLCNEVREQKLLTDVRFVKNNKIDKNCGAVTFKISNTDELIFKCQCESVHIIKLPLKELNEWIDKVYDFKNDAINSDLAEGLSLIEIKMRSVSDLNEYSLNIVIQTLKTLTSSFFHNLRRFSLNGDFETSLKTKSSLSQKERAQKWINTFLDLIRKSNPDDPTHKILKNKFDLLTDYEIGCNDILMSDLSMKIMRVKSGVFKISNSRGYLVEDDNFGIIHIDKAELSSESVWFHQLSGNSGHLNHRILRIQDASAQMQVSNMIIQDQLNLKVYNDPSTPLNVTDFSHVMSFFIKVDSRRLNAVVQNVRYLFMGLNSILICKQLPKKLTHNCLNWKEFFLSNHIQEFINGLCLPLKKDSETRLLFENNHTKGKKDNIPLMIHQFYKLHFFEKSIPGAYQEMWKVYKKFAGNKIEYDNCSDLNRKMMCDGLTPKDNNFFEIILGNLEDDYVKLPTFNNELIASSSKFFSRIKSDRYFSECHEPKPISELCKTASTVNNFKKTCDWKKMFNSVKKMGELTNSLKMHEPINKDVLKKEDTTHEYVEIRSSILKNVIETKSKLIRESDYEKEAKIFSNRVLELNGMLKNFNGVFENDVLIKFEVMIRSEFFQTILARFKLERKKNRSNDEEDIKKAFSHVCRMMYIDEKIFSNDILKLMPYLILRTSGSLSLKELFDASRLNEVAGLDMLDAFPILMLKSRSISNYMLLTPLLTEYSHVKDSTKKALANMKLCFTSTRSMTTELIVTFVNSNPDIEYQSSIDCLRYLELSIKPIVFGMSFKVQFGGERELTIADLIGKITLKVVEDIMRHLSRCCINSCLNAPDRESFHRQLTCTLQTQTTSQTLEWLESKSRMNSDFVTGEVVDSLKPEFKTLTREMKDNTTDVFFMSEDHAKWGPLHSSISFMNLFLNLDLQEDTKQTIKYCLMKHVLKENEIPSKVIERIIKKLIKLGYVSEDDKPIEVFFQEQKVEQTLSKEEMFVIERLIKNKIYTSHRFDMGQGMTHSCSDVYGSFANEMSNKAAIEIMKEIMGVDVKIFDMNTSDDSNGICIISYNPESVIEFAKKWNIFLKPYEVKGFIMKCLMNIRDFVQRCYNIHLSSKSVVSSSLSEFKSAFVYKGSEIKAMVKFLSSQLMIGKDFKPESFFTSYFSLAQQILANGGTQTSINLLACSKYRQLRIGYNIKHCTPFKKENDHLIPPSFSGFPILSVPEIYWGTLESSIFTHCNSWIGIFREEVLRNLITVDVEHLDGKQKILIIRPMEDSKLLSQTVRLTVSNDVNHNDSEELKEVLMTWFSNSDLHKFQEENDLLTFRRLPCMTPRTNTQIASIELEQIPMNLENCILMHHVKKSMKALKIISNQALKSALRDSFKNLSQGAIFSKAYCISKGKFMRVNDTNESMMKVISNSGVCVKVRNLITQFKKMNYNGLTVSESCFHSSISFNKELDSIRIRKRESNTTYTHEVRSLFNYKNNMFNDPLTVLTYKTNKKLLGLIPRKSIDYSLLEQDLKIFNEMNYPNDPLKLTMGMTSEYNRSIEGCYRFPLMNAPEQSLIDMLNRAYIPFANIDCNLALSNQKMVDFDDVLQDLCVLTHLIATSNAGDDTKSSLLRSILAMEKHNKLREFITSNVSKSSNVGRFCSCLAQYLGYMDISQNLKVIFKSSSNSTSYRENEYLYEMVQIDGILFKVRSNDRRDSFQVTCSSDNQLEVGRRMYILSDIINHKLLMIPTFDESLINSISAEDNSSDFDITVQLKSDGFVVNKMMSEENMLTRMKILQSMNDNTVKRLKELVSDDKSGFNRSLENLTSIFVRIPLNVTLGSLFSIIQKYNDNDLLRNLSVNRPKHINDDYNAMKSLNRLLTDDLSRKEKEKCLKYLGKTCSVSSRIKRLINYITQEDVFDKNLPLASNLFTQIRFEMKDIASKSNTSKSISTLITVMKKATNLDDVYKLVFWLNNIVPIMDSSSEVPALLLGDFPIINIRSSCLHTITRPVRPENLRSSKMKKKKRKRKKKKDFDDCDSDFDSNLNEPSETETVTENIFEEEPPLFSISRPSECKTEEGFMNFLNEMNKENTVRYELQLAPTVNIHEVFNYSKRFDSPVLFVQTVMFEDGTISNSREVNHLKIDEINKEMETFNEDNYESMKVLALSLQYSDLSKVTMNIT